MFNIRVYIVCLSFMLEFSGIRTDDVYFYYVGASLLAALLLEMTISSLKETWKELKEEIK